MSRHGVCFDNGISGRCGPECELFELGQCDIGDEICEELFYELQPEEIKDEIKHSFDDVTLFVLRGEGKIP